MKNYFAWLFKFLTVLFVMIFIIPVLIGVAVKTLSNPDAQSVLNTENQVAVIKLDGAIEDSKEVITSLYKYAQDDKYKGLVLRINSPGGAVGPSQDIYEAVKKLKAKKPIIASMGTVAASGGFYAALAASKIYSQPGTLTGSIGVIMQVPNVKKLGDSVGFEMITVKSGALKDVGNPFRDMTPEDRQFLESTVGLVKDEFVNAIVEGRGIAKEKVLTFADGRVIVGSQAKELNLVDDFGDVYDAARAVFDVLGKPLPAGEYPKLVYPDEKFESLKQILEAALQLPRVISGGPQLRFDM